MQGSARDKDGIGSFHKEPCAFYIKSYATHINSNQSKGHIHRDFAIQAGHIRGYLTAVNTFRANGLKDIRRGHSTETVYLYVEKHCRDNPLDDVSDALYSFVLEMERK